MRDSDARDGTARLADEVIRFVRLGQRAKSMLSTGELGAEFSASMLLVPLLDLGPLRVTELAELKHADPSTISRQVAQLVKAGLAHREADPVDGRASRLAITETGIAACRKLRDAQLDRLSQALNQWPAEKIATFAGLFEEFNSSVEAQLRHAPAATPAREIS